MELEEINISDIEEKVSIKKQYFAAAGVAIGHDYFLFTCLEEEKTQRFLRKDGIVAILDLASIYEQGDALQLQQEEKKSFDGEVGDDVKQLIVRLFDRYAELSPEL